MRANMMRPASRRTRVVARSGEVIDSAEMVDRPGKCAACGRPFHAHEDVELTACAAVNEATQPAAAPTAVEGAPS